MAPTGRIQAPSDLVSSHEASVGVHGVQRPVKDLWNSGESLLSSCSTADAVLLRDIKASSTVQLLATVTRIHTPLDFCLGAHMHLYTRKHKTHAHLYITVGTLSLPPVWKQTAQWETKKTPLLQDKFVPVRSCKHTQRHRYAWTHTDYRHKNRCLQTYAYMLHTHTHEHTDLLTNTDVSRQTWTYSYIWGSVSVTKYAVFNSWRHLSEIERHTVWLYIMCLSIVQIEESIYGAEGRRRGVLWLYQTRQNLQT